VSVLLFGEHVEDRARLPSQLAPWAGGTWLQDVEVGESPEGGEGGRAGDAEAAFDDAGGEHRLLARQVDQPIGWAREASRTMAR
jgi:hypothetical protein